MAFLIAVGIGIGISVSRGSWWLVVRLFNLVRGISVGLAFVQSTVQPFSFLRRVELVCWAPHN